MSKSEDETRKIAAQVARESAGPRGANKSMPPEETSVNSGAKDAAAAKKGGQTAEEAAAKEDAKSKEDSAEAQSGPADLSGLQAQIDALQAQLKRQERTEDKASKDVKLTKAGEFVASRRGHVPGQGIIEPNELIPAGIPVGSWMKKAPKFNPDVEPLDELAVED